MTRIRCFYTGWLGVLSGALLAMAGCTAQMEEEIGQCEEGVADLSRTVTVTPPC